MTALQIRARTVDAFDVGTEAHMFAASERDDDALLRELEATRAELRRARAEVVKVSRIAGMAEVATSVLHNVGNVLNGLNVGVTVVRRALHDRPGARIERAAKLLDEMGDAPDAAKLRQVAAYLRRVGTVVDEQIERVDHEVGLLGEKVEHVNAIVGAQQQHARPSGACESVDVEALLRESVRLQAATLAAHGIDVRIECESGSVVVDRHKVLQILVNLIVNAKDAMKDTAERVLTLRGSFAGDVLAIACRDTGIGMDAETLGKVFKHGFTTKPSGHGFGLPASVNDARELCGELRVESDGPGQGACFTLTLPRRPIVSRNVA